MRNSIARRVALTGMLFAMALTLGVFESLLTPFLGLPPGVKLGLANVVVMYALYFLSRKEALFLVVLKAAFAVLTRGAVAGLLSLSGGIVSFLIMVILLLPQLTSSMLFVSIGGSLGHNIGQFIVVLYMFGSSAMVYVPILLLSGVGMGVLTAMTLRVVLPALKKAKIADESDDKKSNK